MNSIFWIAVNLIGFLVLVFMLIHTNRDIKVKSTELSIFKFLQIAVMLFVAFDTITYLLDGMTFKGAYELNHISSVLFYLFSPVVGILYLLYCDNRVYGDLRGLKRRGIIYALPAIAGGIIAIISPFTGLYYEITPDNVYSRGSFIWIQVAITFSYVLVAILLLAVRTKNKPSLPPKGADLYLYIFPVIPIICSVFQFVFYGTLLIGMGFVISVFYMHIMGVSASEGKRNISTRFFNINIMHFAIVALIMIIGLVWTFSSITDDISYNYATNNATDTASTLRSYFNKDIAVIKSTATSKSVSDWFKDEYNKEKETLAFAHLMGTAGVLYGDNIRIVLGESLKAYAITAEISEDFGDYAEISVANASDSWYFALKDSPYDYSLNVAHDSILNKKAVWLNYKVKDENGEMIGAIATDMDLVSVAEQVISQHGGNTAHILIIDGNGVIQIDGTHLADTNLTKKAVDEISSSAFRNALTKYLNKNNGEVFPSSGTQPSVVKLGEGQYRYAVIAPIGNTSWSVIKFYDSSSLFEFTKLLPPFFVIGVLFVVFVASSGRATRRLIFNPILRLVDSLSEIRKTNAGEIYGIERNDEIGLLSSTVHELFVKGHYDGLTGIYNRRFLEETLNQMFSQPHEEGTELSVIMADIDSFKKYNDSYGHLAGDDCLCHIAEVLKKVTQKKEHFASRYGGEEFTVVLFGMGEAGACAVAEKILTAIRKLNIPHEGGEAGIVTASLGVSTGKIAGANFTEFIKKADEALYLSKRNGKNQYSFFELNKKSD